MGIRFHCPNGHKLNVKSFLAGKKGVCPDCGVKLRIPERSEPGLDSGIDEGNQKATLPQPVPAPAMTQPATVAPVAPVAARPVAAMAQPAMPQPMAPPYAQPQPAYSPQQPVARAAQPAYSQQPPVAPVGYAPQVVAANPQAPAAAGMSAAYALPAGNVMPPPPPSAAGLAGPGIASDPIAENPLAIWFVRPPSGGQFGPARGEVMRKWLTEGRVTSDSLVWREGWVDWLAATDVFPSLGKPAAAALFGMQPGASKTAASLPSAKKNSSAMSAAILVLLAIICLVLVGVLAVLLSGGFSST